MRRACVSILIVCIAVCSSAQEKKGNLVREGINGMVSCVTTSSYAGVEIYHEISCGGFGLILDSTYTIHEFDDRGNQTLYQFYSADSMLQREIACKYDDNNRRIQATYRDHELKLIGIAIYKYDQTGFPTHRTVYNGNDSILSDLNFDEKYRDGDYKYCYDSLGRTIQYVNYENDCGNWTNDPDKITVASPEQDTLTDTTINYNKAGYKNVSVAYKTDMHAWHINYLYDETGNEIEVVEYNTFGEQERKVSSEYDDEGHILVRRMIREIDYNLYGSMVVYKYDHEGNKISVKEYGLDEGYRDANNDGIRDTTYVPYEYTTYNSKGRVIKYVRYVEGVLYSTEHYSYDEYGTLNHYTRYDKNNSLEEENFSRAENIDEYGNWGKMTAWGWSVDDGEYKNYVPFVTIRSIEYMKK